MPAQVCTHRAFFLSQCLLEDSLDVAFVNGKAASSTSLRSTSMGKMLQAGKLRSGPRTIHNPRKRSLENLFYSLTGQQLRSIEILSRYCWIAAGESQTALLIGDTKLLHSGDESRPRKPEARGSATAASDDPIRLFQSFQDVGALRVGQCLAGR
jgi:hypothetical protein